MNVTVLVGGVGGARFLLGVRELPDVEVTAVVNVGDDIWLHGLRICPDLDTCMYTLGGGIDTERGWGRSGETWAVRDELAAYGADPDWFGLGDRDTATHLVRTRMLRAGYPLSDVTAALCHRWQPGVTLLPASDDRVETHVVVDDPANGPKAQKAIHFQEWWIRHKGELPAHRFASVGAEQASVLPAARDAILGADAVLFAPSNPVVSVGAILDVPGVREALRDTQAQGGGALADRGRAPAARHGRRLPRRDRRGDLRRGRGAALRRPRRRRPPRRLARAHRRRRRRARGRRARRAAAHDRRARDRRDGPRRAGRGRCLSPRPAARAADHAQDACRRAAITVLPVPGLPEFRPGDDLAGALAAAAPWLADGDVVVVTSKVFSKVEGRLVPAPADPEERDRLRRELVDAETERVVARRGRTLIVAGKLGIVQAAAGVDGSNVAADELALLPADPDASAARAARRPAPGRGRRRRPSSSPTRWAARGGSGRPTSRSARRASRSLHRYARHGRRAGQRAARHRDRGGRRARGAPPTW